MKKYISLFLILIIMVVSFCTPFEVNANPVIWPIVEGAMYLTGTILAAYGISIGTPTESESIRKTKLGIITNAWMNKIKTEWSEPDVLLYTALVNKMIPGHVIQLTTDEYRILNTLAHYVIDEYKDAPSNTVSVDTGYVYNQYNNMREFDLRFENNPDGYSVRKFDNYFDFYLNAFQNGTYRVHCNTNGGAFSYILNINGLEYYYDVIVGGDLTITFNNVDDKINIYGRKTGSSSYTATTVSTNYKLPELGLMLTTTTVGTRTLKFTVEYNPSLVNYNGTLVKDVNLAFDSSVVLDENYTIPDTDGVKKLAIPSSISQFGTTVNTVADVLPSIDNPPTDPDIDKAWWETLIGGAVSGLAGAIGQVGTLVSGIPASIAQALSPATTDIKTIADSMANVEDAVAEADLTDTIKNFDIPDLFILSLRVIIATILMVGRAIVFVITIQGIPPDGSMIPSNMMVGLNYTKNYQLPMGISIWDLANVLIGFLFGLIIFKRVVSNVRR